MSTFSLDELAKSIGQRTGYFVKDAANAGADFVCGLYKDVPGALVPNVANSALRGFWDSLCAPRPAGLPLSPQPPFPGGQCVCIKYRVVYEVRSRDTNGVFDTYAVQVYGPVSHGEVRKGSTSTSSSAGVWARGAASGTCRDALTYTSGVSFGSDFSATRYVRIVSATRVDGLTDTCGNLPNAYPIAFIPSNRRVGSTTYQHNAGDVVNMPISFSQTSIDFPITVNVGGVNFHFANDGCSTDVGTDLQVQARLNELEALMKDVQRQLPKAPKPPSSGEYDVTEITEETSEAKDGIDGLQWIQIELTRSPINAKKQYGREAQDVVYAGWFQFAVDGFYLPRVPIHFKRSMYAAPDGCTGYAYTLYEGYSASVKEFKKKVEPTQ